MFQLKNILFSNFLLHLFPRISKLNNKVPVFKFLHHFFPKEYPKTTTNFPVHLYMALKINLKQKQIQPVFTITSLDLSSCIKRSLSAIPNLANPNTNLVIFLSCRDTESSTIIGNNVSTITNHNQAAYSAPSKYFQVCIQFTYLRSRLFHRMKYCLLGAQ